MLLAGAPFVPRHASLGHHDVHLVLSAAPPSKFTALMAGEDRVVDLPPMRPVQWRLHERPCIGYGHSQFIADVIDPAASPSAKPREMHLVRGLLSGYEVDALRLGFEALTAGAGGR